MALPFFTLSDIAKAVAFRPPARLCVFGDPVGHSLSPGMHNPALAHCGIDASYVRFQVAGEDFRRGLEAIRDLGFTGANVTIPHKLTALATVDETDPAARRLGAVNTILFRGDGTTLGRNSDGPGFVRAIREELGAALRDLRVLIVGAGGGAGRAVAVQCALEPCAALILTNRDAAKVAAVADETGPLLPRGRCRTVEWTADSLRAALRDADLIVNATSLGMNPGDPLPVPPDALTKQHLVFDMVYKPLETPLVAAAKAAGARAINGLPMLLWQGVYSFEWWFGREAPVDVMRAGLQASAAAAVA